MLTTPDPVEAWAGGSADVAAATRLVRASPALGHWGARHVPGGAPTLTHDGRGEAVELVVRCRAGHEVAEDELVVTGPA
jgi:hypothetical protein